MKDPEFLMENKDFGSCSSQYRSVFSQLLKLFQVYKEHDSLVQLAVSS